MSTPQDPGTPGRPESVTVTTILAALKATKDEVAGAKAEIVRLRKNSKRNWRLIVFDIVLTVVLSGVGYLSVHAVQSAGQANSAQLALCQAGNVSRAQQIQLWTHLITVAKPAPGASKAEVARQQAQAAEFLAYVRQVFKPRDCATLGK